MRVGRDFADRSFASGFLFDRLVMVERKTPMSREKGQAGVINEPFGSVISRETFGSLC
jgi:hypothetical protein